jgi:peptidoglycan/xylan/chitin deacetylase (PgdA/CDA1 family)
MRRSLYILSALCVLTITAACASRGESKALVIGSYGNASSVSSGCGPSTILCTKDKKPVCVKNKWICRAEVSSKSSVSSVAYSTPVSPSLKIPILVYHHIRDTKPYSPSTWSWKMSVSPKIFDAQMQWLVDHNYTTIDLNTYVAIMQSKQAPPEKPVVITFDDNNLSQYELGLPILEKNGQVAVFYLITDKLSQKSGVINADIAKIMSDKGMDIESHTLDHVVLTQINAARLASELVDSKKRLEEIIGKPVLHVAYPGTAHNKTVREATAKAGYVTGSIMDPRDATPADDFYKLPRIMMTDTTDLKKVLP